VRKSSGDHSPRQVQARRQEPWQRVRQGGPQRSHEGQSRGEGGSTPAHRDASEGHLALDDVSNGTAVERGRHVRVTIDRLSTHRDNKSPGSTRREPSRSSTMDRVSASTSAGAVHETTSRPASN
jgi:hypothetical protein